MQAFGLLLALIWLIVVVCAGLFAGSFIMAIAQIFDRCAAPLHLDRGWTAAVAVAGCFAWYPLHGIFEMSTVPVSLAFATGICIAMSW